MDESLKRVRQSYDTVAGDYVRHIAGELAGKPFDRGLLDAFAARLAGRGRVADLGCGPGHIGAYLAERGLEVEGWDASAALVEAARGLFPALTFHHGDFRDLPVADGAWAGIVAFYSILHLDPEDLVPTLREWRRVLRPGGLLLLSVHLGQENRHLEEWWGHAVDITFRFFDRNALLADLEAAGFEILEARERDHYPEVEVATRRLYLLTSA